jgi:tRNA A-37 threonylcarbamoyl transferase component Bud32
VRGTQGEFVSVTAGGFHWHVQARCRDWLLGPDGLRLDHWLRTGQAHVVKHGPHRSVYAVRLPGIAFHIKHNRLADASAWFRELLRRTKALSEWSRVRKVSARQVPTVKPLAVGERVTSIGRRESFLITESLVDVQPLDEFLRGVFPALEEPRQTALRQRMATALGQFLAKLHDAGIRHRDLHAGNLLLRLGADDFPSLFLVDLHSVRLGEPLSWKASRENLAIFNRWFAIHANRADRLRFWLAYYRARKSALPSDQELSIADQIRKLAQEVERRTYHSQLAFWARRSHRCLLTNRRFRRLAASSVAGHTSTELDDAVAASLLRDPDEPFRRPGIAFLKNSRTSQVIELEVVVGGVPTPVIYKRFAVKSALVPWLSWFRKPPALRSWQNGHALRDRCLPTAQPLAVFHRRSAGKCREGYLLTVKIPEAVELPRFLEDLRTLDPIPRQRILRKRVEEVARLVRDMHQRQVSHRDLKGANVLTRCLGSETRGVENVWLIDLSGMSMPRRLTMGRKVQNLARLHASFVHHPLLTRTDKLRFLRVYLQWGLFGRAGWKEWWKAIEKATQAKIQRNARTGRPLG